MQEQTELKVSRSKELEFARPNNGMGNAYIGDARGGFSD
jgi:hypothetical protein